MSAYRIGADATQRRVPATMSLTIRGSDVAGAVAGTDVETIAEVPETPRQSTADLVQKAADVYTKWIPGDVLAIYLALTTAFRGTLEAGEEGGVTPHSWGILVAGFALAAGISLLGAIAADFKEASRVRLVGVPEIAVRVLLAAAAFGFWSLTVPGSWWEVKDWDPGVLAAIAFAISIVFALVAELLVAITK